MPIFQMLNWDTIIHMSPDQTPPPQPELFNFFETDPKKNFAPWFIKFIVILIAVGLGIVGAFWQFSYNNYRYGTDALEKSEEQIQAIKQERTQNPTATWQTYRNEEYGFEIKLPPNWSAVIIKEQKTAFEDQVLLQLITEKTGEYKTVCFFTILSNEDWKVLQNADTTGKPVFIASREGGTYGYGCGHEDFGYENFDEFNRAVEAGNLERINNGQIMGPYQEFRKLILPTFKFIPSTSLGTSEPIPGDWKTYTNEGYEIEVKYPPDWELTFVGNAVYAVPLPSIAPPYWYSKEKPGYGQFELSELESLTADDLKLSSRIEKFIRNGYDVTHVGTTSKRIEIEGMPWTQLQDAYIYSNGKRSVRIVLRATDNHHKRIIDQILSTFKFTR